MIAVDIDKLENSWELRYGNPSALESHKDQARDHVDKIFQLKLSLPIKDQKEIDRFIKAKAMSLPNEFHNLFVNGCPKNPRKIKRILNLVRFVTITTTTNNESFQKYFPIFVIWSICRLAYPELCNVIKQWPQSLIQMALIARYIEDYGDYHYTIEHLKNRPAGTHFKLKENLIIPHNRIYDPNYADTVPGTIIIKPSTLKGLEYMNRHKESFYFIKEIAELYDIRNKHMDNTLVDALMEDYNDLRTNLVEVINNSGLFA
jgi:hypothetical protein